jgi:nitrogen fixation-related uncharacterized protein
MKSAFAKKTDLVDALGVVSVLLAALFVTTFFWNASAGAKDDDESFMARLHRASEKRIDKERAEIGFLLELEDNGQSERALQEGERFAQSFSGNSQFSLLMARSYRAGGEAVHALAHYREALQANRDYSDRRSAFYIGASLRPFVREMKAVLADAGAENAALRRDLFYVERSLAGGCH